MTPKPSIVDRVEDLTVHERKNLAALLHDLVNTSYDAAEGYAAAASAVADRALAEFFRDCARDRREALADLRALLGELGEEAHPHPSVAAELHRTWIALRGALEKGNAAAILAECERGEQAALRHYEAALQQKLPMRAAALLLGQASMLRSARSAYDRMRHQY